MFTGLVESKGRLVRRTERGADARLVIRGDLVHTDSVRGHAAPQGGPVVLGESIAIDGVCLTVDVIAAAGGPGRPTLFEADASSETLDKTTLGTLAIGASVNLERAVPIGGRLGGHIVSGHVDGVGRVVSVLPIGTALKVVFEAPGELARYIAPKGSICVSGVSLTVNGVSSPSMVAPTGQEQRESKGSAAAVCFDVMLIPHTRDKTSLDALAVGTRVNLEVDILARYVARLLEVDRTDAASGSRDDDDHLLQRLRASGYA